VVVVVVLECGRKLVINHFVQESWAHEAFQRRGA